LDLPDPRDFGRRRGLRIHVGHRVRLENPIPGGPEIRSSGSAMPDWEEAKPYLSENEFDNELLGPKFPLAIDPSHVARRFAAQRSRFTIFGRGVDGLRKICAKVPDSDCRLSRITIKRASVAEMRRDLATCGISESTIFPDLEGFGRELNGIFHSVRRSMAWFSIGVDSP